MDEAAAKVQISLRAPAQLIADFDRIATVLERDRSWLLLRALRQYLENEGADLLAEAQAIAQLDQGEGIDFDQVMAQADLLIAHKKAS